MASEGGERGAGVDEVQRQVNVLALVGDQERVLLGQRRRRSQRGRRRIVSEEARVG